MNLNIDLESIRRMLLDSGVNLGGQLQTPGSYGRYTPDFSYGSYNIPATDPTYSSGYEYARTIAGGMPFEDVVAPGMSFSPEDPMGYTQADLDLRNRFRGEGPAPVMPSAPTKGTPLEASYETMPYAPVGTPMPTKFGGLAMPIKVPGIDSYDGTSMSPIPEDFLQTIDRSRLGLLGLVAQPKQDPEPERKGLDFFQVDQNLLNFEEIADKIDMDEVAKIDIEKIDIPESVSLFSDILKEPVIAEPTLPSIFDQPTAPVMPTMPMEPMVQPITEPVIPAQTLPQNIFANIPTPQPLPMPVIPNVQTPMIPSFVQPNIDEIVRPISRQGKFLPQQPGLFSLV
jgi:hypothetical protein